MGSAPVLPGEEPKPIFPDHKVIFIACDDEEEAHYLAGLMNSTIARYIVRGYVAMSSSPHVVDHIPLPRFERSREQRAIAREARRLAKARTSHPDRELDLTSLDALDAMVAQLLEMPADDVQFVREALVELTARATASEDPTDDDDSGDDGARDADGE